MAAMYSTNNNMMPNAPHPTEANPPSGSRYGSRPYQPYVFQPNFLKQQMRQREFEKAVRLGQVDEASAVLGKGPIPNTTSSSSSSTLVSSLIEEAGRKKSGRKVIDWASSCALYLERRRWQRGFADVPALLPDPSYSIEMQAPMAYRDSSASSVATKFVRSATNKMKCPVYKVVWTPDGRRLVTGSASGEFTLWNGTAFNFETILQAHDSPVRAMSWSRNDAWLITGDNQGYIKYWQLNMNNVKMYQAHKDQACRSVCFGPTDAKFVTASDDGTVRIWDFLRCHEEHILRGHGSDVKQVDWHPQKSLIVSASKDLHTPVKLWDPKCAQSLATIHAHKGTVMDVRFNRNGNWFLSASRDHLVKLFDIRNLKEEMQVFRGHKKEAFSVAWHPIHEDMFASGGSEGSIIFWQVGEDKDIGGLEGAHDSLIWSLAWHPLGHILVSGSNDHSTKFWTRNRPGDQMRDKYNIFPNADDSNLASMRSAATTDQESSTPEIPSIPGMGDADAAAADVAKREEEDLKIGIPGLDWSFEEKSEFQRKILVQQHESKKKIPYSRPVPRSFAAAWESNKAGVPPRRPRSRTPTPPRDRFEEPPPPWHRDREERLPPRFHHGPPPPPPPREGRRAGMDYPPDDRRPPNMPPLPVDPGLPGDGHPHEYDSRTRTRDRRPDFLPPGAPPELPFHERGENPPPPPPRRILDDFRDAPPPDMIDPNDHDLIVEYPGPDNHIEDRNPRRPMRGHPPASGRIQEEYGLHRERPDPMAERPDDMKPPRWHKDMDHKPFNSDLLSREDQFYDELYNRNIDPGIDDFPPYEQDMGYDMMKPHMHPRGPERGMPRGRARGFGRGRPGPPRGRVRRGGPWNPGDGIPGRGRKRPGLNPPPRMRRGRRPMID